MDIPDYILNFPLPPLSHLVSAMVLAMHVVTIGYIRRPWFKALLATTPVPFTCAYIVSEIPIGSMHLFGLIASIGYHWLVFLLVGKVRLPLLVAIVLSAIGYVVIGLVSCGLITKIPFVVFTIATIIVFLLGLWLYRPSPVEPYRCTAPLWIKLPTVFTMALLIYCMTGLLQGAVTTFPYVGVFASYELRRSLRLLAGQYTINSIGLAMMISTMWVLQRFDVPAPVPILAGWVVVAICSFVVFKARLGMSRRDHHETVSPPQFRTSTNAGRHSHEHQEVNSASINQS